MEVRFDKDHDGRTDIVRAVRGIYRVKGKEVIGKQFGDNMRCSITLKAKDGYAVGGMTAKSVNFWCNGFSLTYMKVKGDGTLDPTDSHESEWYGYNGPSNISTVKSDGTPVIGIVGKTFGAETSSLGIVFKGQELNIER